MIVAAKLARLRQTLAWEYAVRFAFGVSSPCLPARSRRSSALFLAFPGIFPAGVTLVERHERDRKQRHGLPGTRRGRSVAALVSSGAVCGAIGLLAFGVLAWRLLPELPAWQALAAATLAWAGASVLAWTVRFRVRFSREKSGT